MTKKVQNFYTVFNCKVGSTPKDQLLKSLRERLTISKHIFVNTPNSENVLGVSKDADLQKLLESVDYAPADSIGLVGATYFLQLPNNSHGSVRIMQLLGQAAKTVFLMMFRPSVITETIPLIKGRVLFEDLVKLAQEEEWRIYLLGGTSNEADLTQSKLTSQYPGLKVRSSAGPLLDQFAIPVSKHDEQVQADVIRDINKFRPHLLFVAFNFPKQERWLAKNLPHLPVGLGMTVGGTFNYISGKSRIPPEWVSRNGFEWLWRLIVEPWRASRIFRAVVVFPIKVFKTKLQG